MPITSKNLRCKHCKALPAPEHYERILTRVNLLEALCGHPLYVTSGYRCEQHNIAIGGAKKSRHVVGDAADVMCKDLTPRELYDICDADPILASGGLACSETFLHIDCHTRRRWLYR